MSELVSLEIERNCVAGVLRFPKIVSDLPSEITADDFHLQVHKTIFSVVKSIILNGGNPDIVLVADKIKNLGVTVQADFDIFQYLEALAIIQINEKAVFDYFKELKKYSICRELDETAVVIREALRHNLTEPTSKIIQTVDGIYNKRVDLYSHSNEEIIDIYSKMESLLMERAENPVDEMGLVTPFPIFTRYFGGLRKGGVYVFASRPAEGKSTLLNYIANQIALKNKKVKVLYLDTEMESNDIILRMAATMCDVPMWYLDTGAWAKNAEMYQKVMAAMQTIKHNYSSNFFHRYVANVDIDQIISIIRRWYYSTCQRLDEDVQAIVVYDYLKLTGEKINADNREYQIMGEKVNRLKEIVTDIGAPLLSAIQVNRTGTVSNKASEEITDDSNIIALSDRIQWFATYLGIFRRKAFVEIERDGPQFGTHLLKTLKGRFQGKESMGHSDWVKIERNGERPIYKQNYINFNVDNFRVEERSCLRDMVKKNLFNTGQNNQVKDFYNDAEITLEKVNE